MTVKSKRSKKKTKNESEKKSADTSVTLALAGEKLDRNAELVRVAMLNFLKARLSLLKSFKGESEDNKTVELREKINIEMKNWELFAFDEIKKFSVKRINSKK